MDRAMDNSGLPMINVFALLSETIRITGPSKFQTSMLAVDAATLTNQATLSMPQWARDIENKTGVSLSTSELRLIYAEAKIFKESSQIKIKIWRNWIEE